MAALNYPRVLVTGANGFVASYVVSELLEGGHSVVGTYRASENWEAKVAHLHTIAGGVEGGEDRLTLVAADLLDAESMRAAMKGVDAVIHTASPYTLNAADPVEDLIRPAVEGTLNVLDAARAEGISKFVLTSSMASVTDAPDKDHVYTQDDWNVKSNLKRNPYYASKAAAEKAAWTRLGLAQSMAIPELPTDGLIEIPDSVSVPEGADPIRLVSINPFLIAGPEFGPRVNTSNAVLRDLVDGKYPAVLDLTWSFVHVRDVARAHVLAMESQDAEGRYLIAHNGVSMADVVAILREAYPNAGNLPSRNLSCKGGTFLTKAASYFQDKGTGSYLRTNLGTKCTLDIEKVTTGLGLNLVTVRDIIIQTVEDMRVNGKLESELEPAVESTPAATEE